MDYNNNEAFMEYRVSRLNKPTLLVFLCLILTSSGCKKEEFVPPPSCTGLSLALLSKSDASSCTVVDGQIAIEATGGTAPYLYTTDFLSSSSGTFTNLRGGTYFFTVTDANSCTASLEVSIATEGSTFSASIVAEASTVCAPASNGSITVNASGGVEPYEFRRGTGPFLAENAFLNLAYGDYIIEAKDAAGCSIVIKTEVPGMRYATVKSIIELNCAKSGCHNGDIGAHNNYTLFDNVKENSTSIRARTTDLTMPPNYPLSEEQIKLIACWVDEGANN